MTATKLFVFRRANTTVLCALLVGGCAQMNYQDRARTPLKPMTTVVHEKTQNYDVPPTVLEGKRPEYPEPEGDRREKGFVSIIATIDERGEPAEFIIESATNGDFAIAAMEAVAKWRFAPAMKNGRPIKARLRIPMHFNAL